MRNEESAVVFLGIRPLSYIKDKDLRRIAQRMFNERGYLSLSRLHRRCSARIPGTVAQYRVAIDGWLIRNELRLTRNRG